MEALVIPHNRPYVLALMGALLALCSFYFLPYLSVQISLHLFGISADRTRFYMSTELASTNEVLWWCAASAFIVVFLVLLQLCLTSTTTLSRPGAYLLMM